MQALQYTQVFCCLQSFYNCVCVLKAQSNWVTLDVQKRSCNLGLTFVFHLWSWCLSRANFANDFLELNSDPCFVSKCVASSMKQKQNPTPIPICRGSRWAESVISDDHYLRHSGSMHFSTCSSSSVQSPSSTGDFSMRCRVLIPFPQVTLQSLHSDQGVSMQGIVSTHSTCQ